MYLSDTIRYYSVFLSSISIMNKSLQCYYLNVENTNFRKKQSVMMYTADVFLVSPINLQNFHSSNIS